MGAPHIPTVSTDSLQIPSSSIQILYKRRASYTQIEMVANETLKTSKPLSTTAPPAGSLQRLGFIPTCTTVVYGYANHAYVAAKKYVPAGLKPQVESAENLYSKNVQPIVAKFTDGGKEILLVLDNRVRNRYEANSVVLKGWQTYPKAACLNMHIGLQGSPVGRTRSARASTHHMPSPRSLGRCESIWPSNTRRPLCRDA